MTDLPLLLVREAHFKLYITIIQNPNAYTNQPKPLTGEVNNIDHLVTMTPVKGWDILGSKWTLRSWCVFVGGRKNGQSKDLSHCNKGQIVMAGGLGQSISKTATSRSPECSGMQWLVSSRRGQRKSWAPTAHCGQEWGAKAGSSGLIPQKCYCNTNCWKS